MYDNPALTRAVSDFIVDNIIKQVSIGIITDVCICLGKGKNEKFLISLNEKYHFFDKIIALEHPRWIMQYRSRTRGDYVRKYIGTLRLTQF